MVDWDKWQEILNSLGKQKLRTGLTAFGVFWGIFMLVILLGFGTGFGLKIDAAFGGAKNIVFIWSGSPTQLAYKGLGKGRHVMLTQDDLNLLKQNLPAAQLIEGQNAVGSNVFGNAQYIVHEKESGSFDVKGTHAGAEGIDTNRVVEGRYINKLDERNERKVAVIGTRVKSILFKNDPNPIGKSIGIHGIYFQVVGVYKTTQPDEGNTKQSNSVYIPNNSLRRAFNQMDRFGIIYLQPVVGHSAEELETAAKKLIYERQKIHPDDQGVVGSFNIEKIYQQNKSLVSGIIGFSWMVAIGTIIAGVIGVGNIMLVIVKERTREIGLRKALGATPTKISLMIVHESLVITMIAGYSGLVAGVLLLEAIKAILVKMGQGEGMFASPFIDIGTALIALSVLVVAGVVASLLPAMKAALVNPIVALQDE